MHAVLLLALAAFLPGTLVAQQVSAAGDRCFLVPHGSQFVAKSPDDSRRKLPGGEKATLNEDEVLCVEQADPRDRAMEEIVAINKVVEIEQLEFNSGWELQDEGMVAVSALTALRVLKVSSLDDVTHMGIQRLTSLRRLRVLELNRARNVSGIAWRVLSQLKELEELSCYDLPKLDTEAIALLSGLPSLTSLELEKCPGLNSAALRALSSAPNLRRLSITSNWCITGEEFESFVRRDLLAAVRLSCCERLDDRALRALCKQSHLANVELAYCPLSDAGLTLCARMKALQSLSVYGCSGTRGTFLETLGDLPKLTSLDLCGELLSSSHLVGVAKLRHLTHFSFGSSVKYFFFKMGLELDSTEANPRVTTELVDALLHCTQLESVEIPCNDGITSREVARLATLPRLRKLDLSGCVHVGDLGLRSLSRCEQLETLRVGYTGITDSGVGALAMLSTLQELDLEQTAVTDAGVEKLSRSKSLRRIWLSRCSAITEASARFLVKTATLEEVYVYGCAGIESATDFACLLMENNCNCSPNGFEVPLNNLGTGSSQPPPPRRYKPPPPADPSRSDDLG